MKYLPIYNKHIGCGSQESVFDYIIKNLKPSILTWSYFVNWEKVFTNVKDIEVNLNILNYLIGKDNFDDEFLYLVKKHPQIIPTIPALLVRDGSGNKSFNVLVDYSRKKFVYENFDFKSIAQCSDADISKMLVFIEKSGLKKLFTEKRIKNVVDYAVGVEAGLDSNGRKNRSGHMMEEIVEYFIADICRRHDFKYLKEANANEIKNTYGYDVPVDKSSRRYDFVINNNKSLYIVETNYYGGGGSKLKSTAGEYRSLYDILNKSNFKFIWITDGLGWQSTHRPLLETFNHNDYLLNLGMLENNILDCIISENL